MSKFKWMLIILFGVRNDLLYENLSDDRTYYNCTRNIGYMYRGNYYALGTMQYTQSSGITKE